MRRTTPTLHNELNAFGSYEIRWSEFRNGDWRSRRKSTKTGDIEEARLRLARFLLDRAGPDCASRSKVSDIIDAYCEGHLTPRGELKNMRHLFKHVRTVFGHRDPLSITQEEIDEYVRRRVRGDFSPPATKRGGPWRRTVQPQSAAREISAMQSALNWGSRRLMVPGKPNFRFERPASAPPRDRWLNEAQEADVRAKLHRASRSVQLFTLMGLTYGARRGAMQQLRFGPQVSFVSDSIDFNVPGARRTRKRRAVVPMTPEIRQHLEVLLQERGPGALVLETYTYRHFADFMAEIGYEWVTPHVLKHTAITLMLRGGARPDEVAGATETTLSTILGVYRHHCAGEKASIFSSRRR